MQRLFFFYIILNLFFSIKIFAQNQSDQIILMQLKTNKHLIEYYTENGENEKALEEELKQQKINEQIIKTFEKNWDLCPVYFFYSEDTNAILEENFDILFKSIEENKLKENELNKLNDNFIIAYFGNTQGRLHFHALVLTDSKMKQLKKPNTRYVRTYNGLGFLKRSTEKVIEILEKKILFNKK